MMNDELGRGPDRRLRRFDEWEPSVAAGPERPHASRILRALATLAETLLATLVVFFLLTTFVARTYAVEQSSMERTLWPDQRVIIDELTPRFDPYKRGDIVVFAPPHLVGGSTPLIKRVIGVGGDVVEIVDGRVVVNGSTLDEPYTYGAEPTLPRSEEARWIVPRGYVFVLGDHRSVSVDSRVFGPIAVSSLIGRAWLRFMPFDAVQLLTP